MSPVLGAVLLWLSVSVLWWSGWREEVAEGIPYWSVGVFLAGWPIALLWELKINTNILVNGAWAWTLAAVLLLVIRIHAVRSWTALSAGLLLGSIYLLLGRLSDYPFALSHFLTSWTLAIFLGCLAALLLRYAPEQLIAVTISLFLFDAITVVVFHPAERITIGHDSEWMKGWWITVLSARLWSVSIARIRSFVLRWSYKMGFRRGGQRS